MAKSIDLRGLQKQDAGEMSTPPPAQVPPGTRQGPPLPVGEAVRAISPESLTSMEQTQLEKLGWPKDRPIPSNMAEILAAEAAAKAEVAGDLPPPVDPGTPPVKLEITPIEDLTPEKAAEVRQKLEESLAQAATNAADREQAQVVAQNPVVAQKVMAAATSPADTGAIEEPARPATGHVPDPDHVPTAAPDTPLDTPLDAPATGAALTVPNCPHCGWDMTAEDIPEPSRKIRQKFLQSVIGQLAYTNKHELLGGALKITFRTLTSGEADECFRQTFRDRDNGEFISELDFWERVNRYRLYLQIMLLEREDEEAIEMPDGLNKRTAPNATTVWEVPEGEKHPLKLVEKHTLQHVLPSESTARIVQVELGRFNRIVSKLEAMVDNADFWSPTEEPS